ncbi:hypothetical protein CWI75_08750 [Kineobactrum sediminis]|uniref:Zinc finger CHC2-type domain-containing protein n=1 Tax=Kineobactrum sediminis TaxID=1905677 RepID=A0A2N5Y2P1_9GAMM|nr:hypothetical protein [Kineobactrum sediminis]PLW82663.1 hypothetical protein CWI75_08750 [Kineobactrum sediminis]
MNAEQIALALDAKASPVSGRTQYKVRCPLHNGGSQNLYLKDGDDRLLVHCFAGCNGADIIDYLKSQSLLPSASKDIPVKKISPKEVQAFIVAHETMLKAGAPTSTKSQRTYRAYQRMHYKPFEPGEVAEMQYYCLAFKAMLHRGETPTPADCRTFTAYRKILQDKGVPYAW